MIDRRASTKTKRPCSCDKPTCRLCTLFKTNPRYRQLWGGTVETFTLAMLANGIGDALLGLVAVAGAKVKWPAKKIIYCCKNQEWIKLFTGYDELHHLTYTQRERTFVDLNKDYHIECHEKAATPRWQRYCDNAGVEPVAPTLKDRAGLLKQGEQWKDFIALHPFSIYNNRNWSLEGWLTLEKMLLDAGKRVVVLHHNPTDTVRFKGERPRLQPHEVAACILNCQALVGVDSGLAHLSSLVGVKTLVLCGPTDASKIFFTPITPISGHTSCTGCFWQSPYRGDCDKACASLWSISPHEVFAELTRA
jgi:hypothetical protein